MKNNFEKIQTHVKRIQAARAALPPLLPCPFCGSRAELDNVADAWLIACTQLFDCGASGGFRDEPEQAAALWNVRRPTPASLGTCTRCGSVLNNVSPGFSITPSGLVCAPCLRPGEELLRARGIEQ